MEGNHNHREHDETKINCPSMTNNNQDTDESKSMPTSNINIRNDYSVLKYEINEKVYVHEKSQVYLAKIIKTRFHTVASLGAKSNKNKKKRVSLKDQLILRQINLHGPFWEYYVHFNGWSARHDKWCQDNVIMKDNEEARELATISVERQKLEEMKRKEKKVLGKQGKRKSGGNGDSPPKHTKFDHAASPKINGNSNELVSVCLPSRYEKSFKEYCTLPFTLQTILVDDQNRITRLGRHVTMGYDNHHYVPSSTESSRMVHSLPVNNNITVESIMKAFLKSKIKKHQTDQSKSSHSNGSNWETTGKNEDPINTYERFCDDMVQLFDSMLPKFLLYQQERKQYLLLWEKAMTESKSKSESQLNSSDVSMARVYGGEFLLRLFVRLPQFMTSIDQTSTTTTQLNSMGTTIAKWRLFYEKDYQVTGSLISELIAFLQKKRNKCLKGKYRKITVEECTD